MPTLSPIFASLRGLLTSFHEHDILYCHFKSNIHVGSGVSGESDLDLLISRSQRTQVLGLFYLHGFRHFRSGPQTTYPSVEDWIGADSEAALFHLHVHWDLTLGEEFLKGYSIPLSAKILDNRNWNTQHDIFTASPESESLLLAIRTSLRRPLLRSLSDLTPWVSKEEAQISEATWLIQSASLRKFIQEFSDFFPEELLSQIYSALEAPHSRKTLLPTEIRKSIRKLMSPWRTYSAFVAFFRRRGRFFANNLWGRLHRGLNLPFVVRRQPQAGGLIFAIVGPDNSGKSTQAKSAVAWLARKVDTYYLYLGSGNGPKSWTRGAWESLGRVVERQSSPRGSRLSDSEINPFSKQNIPNKLALKARMRLIYKNVFAVLLAIEKVRKLRFAVRARNRGAIVVTDRFPQFIHKGINDGPMLDPKIVPFWSKWELRLLRQVNKIEPDIIIRLRVSADTVSARAEAFDLGRFQKKSEVFDDVRLWPRATRLEVNANRGLRDVESEIRLAIWSSL